MLKMRQRALVSLDMLLDTRYGTMSLIDSIAADEVIRLKAYRMRYVDNFEILSKGRIPTAMYEELYKNRNGDNLFFARFTDFIYFLKKDFEEASMKFIDRGVNNLKLGLDINLWPYDDLTAQERTWIVRSIRYHMPPNVDVETVYVTPEQLTPGYVDATYDMMAWYDHEEWLAPHWTMEEGRPGALQLKPIPNLVLVTPTIASSGVIPEATSEIQDPFGARSAVFVRHVALTYVPSFYASHNPAIPLHVYSSRQKEPVPPEHPPQDGAQPVSPV
jgi:hypothetical protein